MKKTRNAFFSESAYQSYTPNMNMNGIPNQNNVPNQMPFQSASNYFYQGPVPNNYNTSMGGNDIESRFAKIERQLNRIDYRLSKLENSSNVISSDDFDTSNSNMYML